MCFFNVYSIASHSIINWMDLKFFYRRYICTITIDSKIILVVLMWVGNVVITKSVLSSRSTTQTYMVGSDANFFVQLMDAYGNMVNNSFYVLFRSNENELCFNHQCCRMRLAQIYFHQCINLILIMFTS